VHVLTLTATPIPRTLQMAMSGLRELSVIQTPPVDRLAVRTYVMPWDGVVMREALLREHYRGGQSFFVVPAHLRHRRYRGVPARAGAGGEGRRRARPDGAGEVEERMSAFYDKQI
jgi:transcription-repair coupling factor (superfamily II helicase)